MTKSKTASDFREWVEMIVVVIVLVNVLRSFGAEAFVIPTGSMATTLLGAHKHVTCPQCGQSCLVNASDQVESGPSHEPVRARCQNCQYLMDLPSRNPDGGDRVLVGKTIFEWWEDPQRYQVVVFRCPDYGVSSRNYIKRLVGLPHETIGIRYGDLFVRPDGAEQFTIARKPPKVMLAERRLVDDLDRPSADRVAAKKPSRWREESGQWSVTPDGKSFVAQTSDAALEYHHTVRDVDWQNSGEGDILITDFECYNSGLEAYANARSPVRDDVAINWVGDLMLEATIKPAKLEGKVFLELKEGGRIFKLEFDLASQQAELLDGKGTSLAKATSTITKTGAQNLRFANFDDRLTVWVNENLIFGDGVDLEPPANDEQGPQENDLRPCRIGIVGSAAVTVSHVKIYRDLYYGQHARSDYMAPHLFPAPLKTWKEHLLSMGMRQFAIGADEFFMLGDNSMRSSDSREWRRTHVVPRELMVGRAMVLYWPLTHFRFVR